VLSGTESKKKGRLLRAGTIVEFLLIPTSIAVLGRRPDEPGRGGRALAEVFWEKVRVDADGELPSYIQNQRGIRKTEQF